MNKPDNIVKAPHMDSQRMHLRGVIRLAAEILAPYWPMRAFVHHNPLHSLESLHFEEAVRGGRQFLGGEGYLPGEMYRGYVRSGRIRPQHLYAAIKPHVGGEHVSLGNRRVSHLDVLRARMIHGIFEPADESFDVPTDRGRNRSLMENLANRLESVVKTQDLREKMESAASENQAALGRTFTLSAWCDRTLGTTIRDRINDELIKWCGAFLDEDHAAWAMPGREKGFYGAWKCLAEQEWACCGIAESRKKLSRLPDSPVDALLEHLAVLDISSAVMQDYLSLHLAALPGWAAFIKWRAEQTEYAWQQAYPVDLAQILAVRLWYERELVDKACREELGIEGNFGAITNIMESRPREYFLRRERTAGSLPAAYARRNDRTRRDDESRWNDLAERYATEIGSRHHRTIRLSAARRLIDLAEALEIGPAVLIETPPEDLKVLLDWMDAFPESEHGPVWLNALEAGYRERLLGKLSRNVSDPRTPVQDDERIVRPQAQAVFCIDVRSEPFRRHLEAAGDYETLGFAGFFTVFIRYRGLGCHHETDQFPVFMKAKNAVREVPRTYHGERLSRHRAGSRFLHLGHELLHNLKEHVITPYVMVETLGWFYALPLLGKTAFADGYRKWVIGLRRIFAPPVSTTLTVDKLSREEVEEMLAAEQRATIREALLERFEDRDLDLSSEWLEDLRLRALEENGSGPRRLQASGPPSRLTTEEETALLEELRGRYRINRGWSFARMERITRTGFTLSEQVFTVETALRMMGLTRNFARLVLFCGHGSTSENNPFEAALDCGACGGNVGKPNARVLAAMANNPQVRERLGRNGIVIPQDTYFIAGEHDTATDEVRLLDLEDLPPTHRKDLVRLAEDLDAAALQNNLERCARFPEFRTVPTTGRASREVRRRSGDWSQVRPEWGLSGNAALIIGRRALTRGVDLEGRVFLQSYDYREDPTGRLLEILMTGPLVVGQWINMEHYFSTVDNEVYGSGSKIYHNVTGRFGIMSGSRSDLRVGLAWQSVMEGPMPYHEPVRLLTVIEAPRERINRIIERHPILQYYFENEWVILAALDPEEKIFYRYSSRREWTPERGGSVPQEENRLKGGTE